MNDVKRINLDDYIQTGEGATALTYTSKDGKTLAKLYNSRPTGQRRNS